MANIITIPEGAIVNDIDIYINKQTSLPFVNARQYDSGMRYIRASIWNDGDLYPMVESDIICLTATKPDRNPLFNQAGIDTDGRIVYEITDQTTSAFGVFIAEFRIYNTKELENETVSTLKSTYDFKINIAKSNVQDTEIISTPEFNALTDAMASVGDLVTDVNEALQKINTAIDNAEIATTNANTKATLANEKALLADEKATQANNAATLANEKAGLADTATSNANTATTNANTAATSAITATSNANTATTNAQNAADYANDVATALDNETLKIFKTAVSTYVDLSTTYPIPENGWTVTVADEMVSYRYNGTEWIDLGVISSIETATNTTLGIVKGGGNISVAIDGTINVPSIGNINQLETVSKELVGAINEVNAKPSVSTAEDVTYGESNVKIALDDHSSQLADIAMFINSNQGADITTEIQTKVDLINSLGKRGVLKAKGNFLLNGSVTIPDNIIIDFTEAILTTTLASGAMPVNFFVIDGDNVTLKIRLHLTEGQINASTSGRGIGFSDTKSTFDNITIENCDIQYTCYCVNAFNKTFINFKMRDNNFIGMLRDIHLNKIHGKDLFIEDNYFPIDRDWSSPYTFENTIMITGGFDFAFGSTTPEFTDTIYNDDYFENVVIKGNTLRNPSKRVFFITNARNVEVKDNKIFATQGVYTTLGITHDVICLEYCRHFEVEGNSVMASGENGLDLLGCKYGRVTKNNFQNIHTNAIHLDVSDKYIDGHSPNLNPLYELPEDIIISDNTLSAAVNVIFIALGKDITFNGNSVRGVGNHVTFNPRTSFMNASGSPTAGYSVSDASPSTDISGGTDSKFNISVDGDVAQEVVLDVSGKNTGILIASEMQTKIRALGGNKATVTVNYGVSNSGKYTIISGTTGIGSGVVLTNGATNNVADNLKLGVGNAGKEVIGYGNLSLYLRNIKFTNTIISETARVFFNSKSGIVWGTLELGKALAIESSWINASANTLITWGHGKGIFPNVEIYFYLDPELLGTYRTDIGKVTDRMRIWGKYTTVTQNVTTKDVTVKTKGTTVEWYDIDIMYLLPGDYILDVKQRVVGEGRGLYLGEVTSGKIKVLMY